MANYYGPSEIRVPSSPRVEYEAIQVTKAGDVRGVPARRGEWVVERKDNPGPKYVVESDYFNACFAQVFPRAADPSPAPPSPDAPRAA